MSNRNGTSSRNFIALIKIGGNVIARGDFSSNNYNCNYHRNWNQRVIEDRLTSRHVIVYLVGNSIIILTLIVIM